MVHIQQGRFAEAIDDLQNALKLQNDSLCLGPVYARTGRKSDAVRVLEYDRGNIPDRTFPRTTSASCMQVWGTVDRCSRGSIKPTKIAIPTL
jgi:hypothetical protein